MLESFNWVLNLVPVISTVVGWFKKLFNVKLVAFLVLKGILFFLAYKYLPFLFGRIFQWVYDLSADTVDLSTFSSLITSPQLIGFPAWVWVTMKLDVCFRLVVAGAVLRLGLKKIPFMS